MADENSSKKLTLGVFSHAMQTLATTIKGLLFDAAGKIKAALIPVGAGLKVTEDGKVAFDSDNIQIDADKVNIADASKTVKGLVQVGDGINVTDGIISVDAPADASKTVKGLVQVGDGLDVTDGVISVIAPEEATEAEVDAAVTTAFNTVFNAA